MNLFQLACTCLTLLLVGPIQAADVAIVIHGGAGTIDRASMTDSLEAEFRDKLAEALNTGHRMLREGASALDAVEQTVRAMEDSPLFNAGKGSVFNAAGFNELDASIMDGATGQAGAVGGVQRIANPISLARTVMEQSPHVLMTGDGAEDFAQVHGIEFVDPHYFFTQRRYDQYREKIKQAEGFGLSRVLKDDVRDPAHARYSTVGVIALDAQGHLAAGTSTGGLTAKQYSRVGDTPLIGAGTYAETNCGVSATGHGEYFMRNVVAYDICARARYKNMPVAQAAAEVIAELKAKGGNGGVITMDGKGNIATPFNTSGMYRGWVDTDGKTVVRIYAESPEE